MPKVYCGQHALSFCRRAVGGILFCRKIFYPIATIVMGSGRLADKVVIQEASGDKTEITFTKKKVNQ